MSAETLEWLNNNTLIGFTESRGSFWHYREEMQNGELNNHYAGAIPIEDVRKRLFFWNAVQAPATYTIGGRKYRAEGKKVVVREDDGTLFYVSSDKYKVHQYGEWLLDTPMKLLDVSAGQLQIGSAGLLQKGGRAWVQLETPEGVTIGGDKLVPFIVATTAHNGTGATEFRRGFNRVGCDNTLDSFLANPEPFIRVKHTKNSRLNVRDAREILEVGFTDLEGEMAAITRLAETEFTDEQFAELVKRAESPKTDSKAGITIAAKKTARLLDTWDNNGMVANIKGTAWGAVQTFNTVEQHFGSTKGTTLAEKTRLDFLSGKTAKDDGRIVLIMQEMGVKL